MTKQEFDEMAALVVRLREDLALTTDSLRRSNAQCSEFLRQNERLAADGAALHRELVEVRAALAATTEQRDSCRRTLYELEHADTKPHERVAAEDVADHVVPPVLSICMTCHECGGSLKPSPAAGSHSVLHCRTERCSRKNTAWQDDIGPYAGPCKSSTPVRHE